MSPDKHFDKLSSTNYATWSVRMQDYLVIKDCFAAIEFELNDDGAFGGSPAANNAKIASSKLALSYIKSNCDDRWVRRLAVPTVVWAHQAWALLADEHASIAKSIAGSLRRNFFSYVQTEDQSIDVFIDAVLECEAEMLRSGNFIDNDSAATVILDGALPRYRATVRALQVGKDTNLIEIRTALLAAEVTLPSHSQAMFIKRNDRTRNKTPKSLTCNYCGNTGHAKWNCELFKQTPEHAVYVRKFAERNATESSNQPGKFMPGFPKTEKSSGAFMATSMFEQCRWIIDSGATEHMTYDLESMSEYRTTFKVSRKGLKISAAGI